MQNSWSGKEKIQPQKYTRIDEFRDQLFEAIYENDFELSKIIIDRKQSVNIKNIDGGTPLIVVCQQTTLETEEEAVKFINFLWEIGSIFSTSDYFGKTAMYYADVNGLEKIKESLDSIERKILSDNLSHIGLIWRKDIFCGRKFYQDLLSGWQDLVLRKDTGAHYLLTIYCKQKTCFLYIS